MYAYIIKVVINDPQQTECSNLTEKKCNTNVYFSGAVVIYRSSFTFFLLDSFLIIKYYFCFISKFPPLFFIKT